MDVQCERCRTEYEFDDALVSSRGTTVRCTNCGHQFKVRRPDGAATADQWLVRVDDGRQLAFLTLRDLQQAILSKQVSRADALVRGPGPPRPLGSIAELEPFFEGRTSSRPPPRVDRRPDDFATPVVFPPVDPSSPWARDASAAGFLAPPAGTPAPDRTTDMYRSPGGADVSSVPSAPVRQKVDTLRPPLSAGGAPPPPALGSATPDPVAHPILPAPSAAHAVGRALDTWGGGPPFGPPDAVHLPANASDSPPFSSGLPPPTQPIRRPAFRSETEDDLGGIRSGPSPSSDDPLATRRSRVRVGGWIVAFVLLLAVSVVGWAVAKPYLVHRDGVVAAQLDPRAQSFLSEGEKAMADGNLDAAQQAFDKASALAERDPRVLLDTARVMAAKADVPWLALRLLAPDAKDEIRTTSAQLDDWAPRLRRAADEALASAPDDLAAQRAEVDALRLSGDRPSARSHVAKLAGQASQPETAYVLAALDLAEPSPLWTTVIERLRLAGVAEENAGRAQAALVYALAASGDVAGARAELTKLDALVRPYPLSPLLHAFVSRPAGSAALPSGSDVLRSTLAGSASAALRSPPGAAVTAVSSSGESASRGQSSPPGAPARHGASGAGAPVAPASDARTGMQLAAQALKKADFNLARQIYQGIVDRNPNDSEAITGLGDVARVHGDGAGAIAAYRRAITVNPSYLPALLGLADTEWAGGDRSSATRAYADIVDHFPEGTYPAYVARRAASGSEPALALTQGAGSGAAAGGGGTSSSSETASPPVPPPAESSP